MFLGQDELSDGLDATYSLGTGYIELKGVLDVVAWHGG
jgi:hypothetical protein